MVTYFRVGIPSPLQRFVYFLNPVNVKKHKKKIQNKHRKKKKEIEETLSLFKHFHSFLHAFSYAFCNIFHKKNKKKK